MLALVAGCSTAMTAGSPGRGPLSPQTALHVPLDEPSLTQALGEGPESSGIESAHTGPYRQPGGQVDDDSTAREGELEFTARDWSQAPNNLVKALRPSNDRNFSRDQAVLPWAERDGDRITVHNIRFCEYTTAEEYTVDYYDATYRLSELESVDLVAIPFLASPTLAHMMMSFGFSDGRYLGVSVEIRKEEGESFAPLKGVLRQFELMYVVGDERDLIRLCTDHYLNGVYLYPVRAPKEEVQAVFLDVMHRVNQLRAEPEFYNTFTNNCTTNIVRHFNRAGYRRIPYSYEVLLPGLFPRLAYELDMIHTERSFEESQQLARINRLAYLYGNDPDFSRQIRRNWPVRR